MKVCFVENTSVINREHHLPMGSLTCEQLNSRGWDEYRLLGVQLDFFEPYEETKVSDLLAGVANIQKSVDQMKVFLTGNRYYQMSDEAANTFAWVESVLNGTRQQVQEKMKSEEDCVFGLGVEIDTFALRKASEYVDAMYTTHAEAVRLFTEVVDAVMIQNDAYPQRRPIDRLYAYGFDRFQNEVREVVQESETAASSVYAPDFELLTLSDGTVKIAPVVSINNAAQLMYHEIMNMIMQGHSIRRCKNCGKYFVQYGERIVDYCDEIPEGETKPCSMIGSSRQFTASLKDDPIKQTYTRVYKKYVARRRLKTVTEGQFAEWSAQAKKLRAHAYEVGMHEETFREKLDDLMAKITGEIRIANSRKK